MKKVNLSILFLLIIFTSSSRSAVISRSYGAYGQTCNNAFFHKFPKLKTDDFERKIKYACKEIKNSAALSCAQRSFQTFSWIKWTELLAACGTIELLSTYDYCVKDILDSFSEDLLHPLNTFYRMKHAIYEIEECGRTD